MDESTVLHDRSGALVAGACTRPTSESTVSTGQRRSVRGDLVPQRAILSANDPDVRPEEHHMKIPKDDPLALASVQAIQSGDVATLKNLLTDHAGLATA